MNKNRIYVLNKEEKLEKFKEILKEFSDSNNLILIKDNINGEFKDLVENNINDKVNYNDNTIRNHLILDYEHITLKTKIKAIYIKENYENNNIFRDLEAYIRDNQSNKRDTKNIKRITVVLNNYNKKSEILEKIVSVSRSFNINFIFLNEEVNELSEIILSNLERE